MNSDQFIELLDKFFNRDTSYKEERFLCELLLSGDYPHGFSEQAELALYYFLEEMKCWPEYPNQEKEIERIQVAYDCVRYNTISRRKRVKRAYWPPVLNQASMAIRGFFMCGPE